MLIKVRFTNEEKLIILEKNTFEEVNKKIKHIFKIENGISIECSGCNINSELFDQLVKSFENEKELITLDVKNNLASEILKISEVLEIHEDFETIEEYQDGDQRSTGNKAPSNEKNNRVQSEVHPKIAAINFKSIFEIAKIKGQLNTGNIIQKKDRVSCSKAIVKTVFQKCGFDYK